LIFGSVAFGDVLVAPNRTVTVYRVQGGKALSGQPSSRQLIGVDEFGVDKNLPNIEGGTNMRERHIRARFTEDTIRVYQAYSSAISEPAIAAQRFVPPFRMTRMTWIKPSFFWMMYRSGWATKGGQERVLAIDISRTGFDWALENACLSHFDSSVHASREAWGELKQDSPVRIQWDPERDFQLERLGYQSIQIGLTGEAAERYVNEWVRTITDITETVTELRDLEPEARAKATRGIVEHECPYPLQPSTRSRIGIF